MGQIGNTMEQEKRINGADLSGQVLVSNIDKKQRVRWYKAHFICYEIFFKNKISIFKICYYICICCIVSLAWRHPCPNHNCVHPELLAPFPK